jgi:hypothetical protein
MEKRDNSGSMSRNKDKTDANPNWADYKGKATINGQTFWISGWIKDGEDGKWMSLAFKAAEQEAPARPAKRKQDEDIPF